MSGIDRKSLRRHSLATLWKLTITNTPIFMAQPRLSPATITMIITSGTDIIMDIAMELRQRMRDGSVGPSS